LRDIRIEAGDTGGRGCKPGGQAGAKGLRASGDNEGDKDDQHGIFDSARTTLITTKGSDQIEHFGFLLPVKSWLYASALMAITTAMQPTCRLTMCSQHRVQAGVRKSPFRKFLFEYGRLLGDAADSASRSARIPRESKRAVE
jgi:hypothetical protein